MCDRTEGSGGLRAEEVGTSSQPWGWVGRIREVCGLMKELEGRPDRGWELGRRGSLGQWGGDAVGGGMLGGGIIKYGRDGVEELGGRLSSDQRSLRGGTGNPKVIQGGNIREG